ncbi:hypothetical protein EV360DRAFT_67744 [Lentinula raphanica]|nr:hypothetical protein EV360DRAFT_67744 [Lentinula raphanica]
MNLATEMNAGSVNNTQPSSTDNANVEEKEQDRHNYILDKSDCPDPIDSLPTQDVAHSATVQMDSSVDVEEIESISPPSSASASILSMPDPLSSSNTTSVQYDTIHITDYASMFESESGVSSPSVLSRGTTAPVEVGSSSEPETTQPPRRPQPQTVYYADHDHDLGTESDPESESSFPSVSSSFFFSSPASVASHGLAEDSHEESNEDGESRSLRATRELVIPSLMLPEALDLSNIVNSHPLETPHPPKPSLHHFQTYTGPSTSNFFRLLVVEPSDFRRSSTEQVESSIPLSNRIKKDLDEVVSKATSSKHSDAQFDCVALQDQDMEAALSIVIDSFVKNELFTAVVLTSEISNEGFLPDVSSIKHEIAQFSEALSPLVPVIYLLFTHTPTPGIGQEPEPSTSQSTARRLSSSLQNSPLIPTAALSVSTVEELHDLLSQRPDVAQRLRAEAVEKFMKWTARKQKAQENTRLDAAPIAIASRRARNRRGHQEEFITLEQNQTDVSVPIHRDDTRSEGSWRQFKAEWEARWEAAYSSQRQNHFSREVGSHPDSEEELLRTARIRTADPLSHVRSSTLRARKQSRLKRSSLARPYSSSSSSPVPATSPSLPPSSAFPSTMPSSSSLSDSIFLTADEIPDTPSRPPIPLVVAFPFPSTTVSLYPPPSRNSSRARSRGVTPGSISPYRASEKFSSSHSTPFLLDLNTGRFEALRFPDSLLALSFSILAPLRAHMRSATQWMLSMPLKAAGSFNEVETNEDQTLDDTLMDSVDSVDTINNDHNESSSSSFYRFRQGLWPTGVMLVGGFLLGFAVGYLRGL